MTTKTGRNAPCPCGSGRKYKRCCLSKKPPGPRFTASDREGAIQKLCRGLERARGHNRDWQELEAELAEEFWEDLRPAMEQLGNRYVSQVSEEIFINWMLYDAWFDDELRPVDYLLEHAPALDLGEQRWLELEMAQSLRLYEISDVHQGVSLTLRDVLDGSEITVRERLGSRSAVRWDLIAARVLPVGASGQPEMDGATLHFPRLHREMLIGELKGWLAMLNEDCPGATTTQMLKLCAPGLYSIWLSLWIEPQIPEAQTTSGEALLMTTARFDVDDSEALIRALDGCQELERDPTRTAWLWLTRATEMKGLPGDSVLGTITLEGSCLTLETLSRERAEQCRALIERLAGPEIRHQTTCHSDPHQEMQHALRDHQNQASGAQPVAGIDDGMKEGIEDELQRLTEAHYRRWVDEEIPALDHATPRRAARSKRLRSRLVSMLQDLEHSYLKALKDGQPAYDPSWMWSELGLQAHPDAPPSWPERPPRLGHETLELLVPGIGEASREIAGSRSDHSGAPSTAIITQEELDNDFIFRRFLLAKAEAARRDGLNEAEAARLSDRIRDHLAYLCNHELHHRRTFWVDEGLSWQLSRTALDLNGPQLRLPFTSCAFVFTDRHCLGIAERLMARDPDCELRGQMIRVATVYLSQTETDQGTRLRVSFNLDALRDDWPWLLVHELTIDHEAPIEAVLGSPPEETGHSGRAPAPSAAAARDLIHIVLNAVLYATSSGVERQVRPPLPADAREPSSPLTTDEVFFLPGKIEISRQRQLEAVERAPNGRQLMHRFMVRGHWRRANPSWKDQRPRWIRPHWKGPDLAAIIEREYRMRE